METFENDTYKVEAEKSKGCQLAMSVMISPEETKKAYKKATQKVNKQISVPGFRKGKAPDHTVVSQYGSYIDQEWKDILIQYAVEHGFALSKIYPLRKGLDGRPKIALCSQEEGAKVTYTYEYYPEIPTIDFSKISIPKIEKAAPKEEQVNEVLFEVQRSNAEWEPITDRTAKEGDYVNLSVRMLDPDMAVIENRRVPLESGHIAPWLQKAIIGMKAEEVKESMSEGDKPSKVNITVHSIWKILLPEVNDELATKVGASSKDDLLEKIRQNLDDEAEHELRRKQIAALENSLLDTYTFDLPKSLCESEREIRIKEKIAELKKQQLSDEEIKEKGNEIEEEVSTLVERSLRLFFLNKQLIKQGEVNVTQKELNDELMRQMAKNPMAFQKGMEKGTTDQMVGRLQEALIEQKTKEYALSQLTNS